MLTIQNETPPIGVPVDALAVGDLFEWNGSLSRVVDQLMVHNVGIAAPAPSSFSLPRILQESEDENVSGLDSLPTLLNHVLCITVETA